MVKLRGTEDLPFYFGASPELLKIAWELRKNTTPAEKVLWEKLRRKQMMGYRFRRQHPVWQFVVDFFCYETMLAIEIDGAVHEDSYQAERDVERTRILKRLGIAELRFTNKQVQNSIDTVLEEISTYLKSK